MCDPLRAQQLHEDAGQLLIKLNPHILTTFDLSEVVPKKCKLCGYIYVAAQDECVHYDICLEWRKKIASLPKTQKVASQKTHVSLEPLVEEIDVRANKKALGQSKAYWPGKKANSISVNIVSQNVRHLDVDES